MSAAVNRPRPMRLNRLASLYWHEGEWEPCGRCAVHVYDLLDFDGPADCRPVCHGLGEVDFYDATGNKLLAKDVRTYSISGGDELLCVGGVWYSVTTGRVIHRGDGWYMRWLGFRNTRTAVMANAGFYAYQDPDPWIRPLRWLWRRALWALRGHWRAWCGRNVTWREL